MSNSLRNEKIKKWTLARKGRMSLLAKMLKMDKQQLYRQVNDYRLSPDLIAKIEVQQKEIHKLEIECIRKFEYLKRFAARKQGRITKLSKKLGVPLHKVRELTHATGDSRYLMLQYGTKRVMTAMREVEKDYSRYSDNTRPIKTFLTREVIAKSYTLKQIEELAGKIKDLADHGNHDAAFICQSVGRNKYKILSTGFDSKQMDMCKSHICDHSDPHLHAFTLCDLNFPKKDLPGVGEVVAFGHSAPCPTCAQRLYVRGVSKVYCYFEPERMGGLDLLAKHGIPVLKINVANGSTKKINCLDKAA